MRRRLDVNRSDRVRSDHPDAVFLLFDPGAGFAQLAEEGLQRRRLDSLDQDIPPGHCRRHHVGPGLDPVGHDPVVHRPQLLDADDGDGIAAGPFDVRPHADQRPGEIDDLRLAGGIFDHRRPLGQSRCHQQVFGAADSRHVEGNPRPL